MPTQPTFSSFIQDHRKAKALTQQQVAVGLGVSRTTVTNWETGFRLPTTRRLYQLFDLLSLSITEQRKGVSLHAAAAGDDATSQAA